MARLDALDPVPQVYVHWVKRFLLFHQQRQAQEMGAPETHAFLVYLALHDQGGRLRIQNVALNALTTTVYTHVLQGDGRGV